MTSPVLIRTRDLDPSMFDRVEAVPYLMLAPFILCSECYATCDGTMVDGVFVLNEYHYEQCSHAVVEVDIHG